MKNSSIIWLGLGFAGLLLLSRKKKTIPIPAPKIISVVVGNGVMGPVFKINYDNGLSYSTFDKEDERIKEWLNNGGKIINHTNDFFVTGINGIGGAESDKFYHNGKEAIKYLMKTQCGECRGALYREDIGDIDLIWGEVTDPVNHKGYGLSHIIEKHGSVISYNNIQFNIEDFIPIVIQFGIKKKENSQKIIFEGNGFRFVVRKKLNGEHRKWLLTAFDLS